MSKLYIWRAASVVQETSDTITIRFNTGNEYFLYKAGQFVNLTILIDGNPVTRSYSLSSVPGLDAAPSITVKKIQGGLMSSYIVDHYTSIDHWQVEGPYGSFTPPSQCSQVVILTAGSGITPVYPIAVSVLRSQLAARVTIIYSNRTAGSIIFRKQLEQLKERFGERVNIIHVLSQDGEQLLHGCDELITGRLNRIILKKLIKKYVDTPASAHYFICGPSLLIKLHQDCLQSLTVPTGNIYEEWYHPEATAAAIELPTQMHEVMFHFYEQSNLLEVQPGSNILHTALQERIAVPNSCNNGTCGKCAAKLTSGNIVMKQNYVLRKEELEAGLVLLCQSYPLNSDVTVEIGS
ncbi:MAG: 2Fe-2S iron-sulfur cluster binding domain-containing protein [Chitinophagaceae bacterium]|nr:2Fe-2S iron-sulfur cluster binding domain-containing protein [Chitinophagaceae bacterium]